MKLFYLLIAFAAGIASSFQGLYNGFWQQKLDLKIVLLVNASVVMAAALAYYLLMALRGAERTQWEQMTPEILVGGLCGVLIIAAMALAFPRIGALSAVILFIAGQMTAALLISHFGLLGLSETLSITKISGALLVVVGTYLVLR